MIYNKSIILSFIKLVFSFWRNSARASYPVYSDMKQFEIKNHNTGVLLDEIEYVEKLKTSCKSDLDCVTNDCFGSCVLTSCQYSTEQCEFCGRIRVKIEIKTDSNPEQSSWTLKTKSGDLVRSGGPFIESNKRYEESFCLMDTSYSFVMHDSYGDGLAKDSYYKLYMNDNVIREAREWAPFNFETSVLCSTDSDCDSGNSCTKDTCNNRTKKCSTEIIHSDSCGSFGDRKVLALRINAQDSSTSSSLEELSDHIFGSYGKDFSMRSQFSACSYNQFNLNPFSGITSEGTAIHQGTSDLDIQMNVKGVQANSLVSAVILAATKKFGDLQSQFDFVMICLPPGSFVGSSENWIAYSFVQSYLSVYNDVSCIFPSVQMHEIGHNLGLSHSNDEEEIYADETCVMGLSYRDPNGPRKCFNGPKSWQLGWYLDRNVAFDRKSISLSSTYGINIVGSSEYKNRAGAIIVKAASSHDGYDYYVTFNYISELNSGVSLGANEIIITRRRTGSFYSDSYLVAKLSHAMHYVALDFYQNTNLYWSPSIYLEDEETHAVLFVENFFLNCEKDDDCDDGNSCSIDTCTDFGKGIKQCTYTDASCSDCGANLGVEVLTNSQPFSLFWDVENLDTGLMKTSGHFTLPYSIHIRSGCLAFGKYKYLISYTGESGSLEDSISYSVSIGNQILDSGIINEDAYKETVIVVCNSDEQCNDYDGCSIDSCILESRLCSNVRVENEECMDCTWVSLNLKSDNFIDETSWDLSAYQTKSLVISGNPYALHVRGYVNRETPLNGRSKAPTRVSDINGRRLRPRKVDAQVHVNNGNVIFETCLAKNYLYHFIIKDSFGDGICCSEGEGFYSLDIMGYQVFHGSNFTTYEEEYFKLIECSSDIECEDSNALCTRSLCLSSLSTCAYYVKPCDQCGAMIEVSFTPDESPQQSSFKISDINDIELISEGPYTTAYETYRVSQCFPFGRYTITILDTFGDGMIACYQNSRCGYSLSINNNMLIQGEVEFGTKDVRYVGVCENDSHCEEKNNEKSRCTKSTCDVVNKVCISEPLPCEDCGMHLLSLTIFFESHPTQNEWKLISMESNRTLFSGGPYLASRQASSHEVHECIQEGAYTFIFMKSCIDLKECSDYSLSLNNNVILQGDSQLQNEEIFTFTIPTIDSVFPTSLPSVNQSKVPSLGIIWNKYTATPSVSPSSLPSKSVFSTKPSIVSSVVSSKMLSPIPTIVTSTNPSKTSNKPSFRPSRKATEFTLITPSISPSHLPSFKPTISYSLKPSDSLTENPTKVSSNISSVKPSSSPTSLPSKMLSYKPTKYPSSHLSRIPTAYLSFSPLSSPTFLPSITQNISPSGSPSSYPSLALSKSSSENPSFVPSILPTKNISQSPSIEPSFRPTQTPMGYPSIATSYTPSIHTTSKPSADPTNKPLGSPTILPTKFLSKLPSFEPTVLKTNFPSSSPSSFPPEIQSTFPSWMSSTLTTSTPSLLSPEVISSLPSTDPSVLSSNAAPSFPTSSPTKILPLLPSRISSSVPSLPPSEITSSVPSVTPTMISSVLPTVKPTKLHSLSQSKIPSKTPTPGPSIFPSVIPSYSLSSMLSQTPSKKKSNSPSTSSPTTVSGYVVNDNACWTAGAIKHLRTPEECQLKCTRIPECKTFSYSFSRRDKICHLCKADVPRDKVECNPGEICSVWGKRDDSLIAPTISASPTSSTLPSALPSTAAPSTEFGFIYNLEACWSATPRFVDNLASPEECQLFCTRTENCQSFAYHHDRSNKRCHLCQTPSPKFGIICTGLPVCTTWGLRNDNLLLPPKSVHPNDRTEIPSRV